MKLSLQLRIFLLHSVVILVLVGVTAVLVGESVAERDTQWEGRLRTLSGEQLFVPLGDEIARSLLLGVQAKKAREPQQDLRRDVGDALDAVLPVLPSVDSLVVIDDEGRVQYSSTTRIPNLTLENAEHEPPAPSGSIERSEVLASSGERLDEVVFPVFDDAGGGEPLGHVFLRLRRDPKIAGRLPWLRGGDELSATERLIAPMTAEIARGFLEGLEEARGPAERDRYKHEVSTGLERILDMLPGVVSLLMVDGDLRIQFASRPIDLDLRFTDPELAELLASDEPVDRITVLADGEPGREIIWPVSVQNESGSDERLGSLMIQFRPDPKLEKLKERFTYLGPAELGPFDIKRASLYLAVAFGGGILLAALGSLPVRRLDRALADFRARGFKGGLDPKAAGLDKDLTSAVDAINELGGRLEALDARGREREALMATLSQSLQEAMVALDPSGKPVAWNPAALRLLLSGSDTGPQGEPSGTVADLGRALDRNPDLLFEVASDEPVRTREMEVVTADGRRVPAEVTRVSFEFRPGEAGTLLLLRNLATLRKVEAHLLEAGRFAVLAHLAGGLAHEIKNPLHTIGLNASVIRQYVSASAAISHPKPVAEALEAIHHETQRLDELAKNYLGLLRPDQEAGLADVRELCSRVIRLVRYEALRSDIRIRLEGDDGLPSVKGVPGRLQQAILNLVLNAIQAMPEGGEITLQTSALPGVVRLTVSDTGPGLPQDLADQFFDTRVTTKPEGSGLGLPLVRMIVEAHGGSVWYRSSPGRGAAFTLVLPAH